MISRILYITSFNKELFEASGKRLCESFVSSKTPGRLWVASEGMDSLDIADSDSVSVHPIDLFPGLSEWQNKNRDIIPKDLGGTAVCKCPGKPEPQSKKHKERCPGAWFNRYASRWFRKVVAMIDATRSSDAEIFVWIDSDCLFKKRIPDEILLEALKGRAIGYMKSPDRKVIESGLILMHAGRGGTDLIESVYDRYMTGRFRNDLRWDDGYQFQMAIKADQELASKSTDMASRASGHADVLCHTVLAPYIDHQKGRHSRILKIRK